MKHYINASEITTIKVPVDEQECIIGWSRNEKIVTISTNDNTTLTRLKKAMTKSPSSYKCWIVSKDSCGNPTEYGFEVTSKRLIKFGTPINRKPMDEFHRQLASERFKKLRES